MSVCFVYNVVHVYFPLSVYFVFFKGQQKPEQTDNLFVCFTLPFSCDMDLLLNVLYKKYKHLFRKRKTFPKNKVTWHVFFLKKEKDFYSFFQVDRKTMKLMNRCHYQKVFFCLLPYPFIFSRSLSNMSKKSSFSFSCH